MIRQKARCYPISFDPIPRQPKATGGGGDYLDALAYLRWKRWTRPSVSISLAVPV